MGLRRTAIHLDQRDMKLLARFAKQETERVGNRVTAASIVRRLIRQYIREHQGRDRGSRQRRLRGDAGT